MVSTHEESLKEISTYQPILDNCCHGTFVLKDLLSALGVKGVATDVTIKTLVGFRIEKSLMVKGLQVKPQNSENGQWIRLPITFSKSSMSINDDVVPTSIKN